MDKKILSYWWVIQKNRNGTPHKVAQTQHQYYAYTTTWRSTVEELKEKYAITMECANTSKAKWRNATTRAIHAYYDNATNAEAANMSKGKDLVLIQSSILNK